MPGDTRPTAYARCRAVGPADHFDTSANADARTVLQPSEVSNIFFTANPLAAETRGTFAKLLHIFDHITAFSDPN